MTSNQTIIKIMSELNVMFQPMDAEVLAKSIVWAKGRVAAIKAFKDSLDFNARKAMGSSKYYDQLFAIAGGKTWYNVFNGRNETMINEFVEKNCKATAEQRNVRIAKKLEAAGVTEAKETTYTRTTDGFNCCIVLNTDKGEKVCRIETIHAGGYNIQCFHLRVLVNVK